MIEITDPGVYADFCEFSTQYIRCWDIDPTYPVLKAHHDMHVSNKEQAVWFTFLYQSVYDLGSAEVLWDKYPEPTYVSDLPKMRTGLERRQFRGVNPKLAEHINDFVDHLSGYDGPWSWVNDIIGEGGKQGWQSLREACEDIRFNGKWASYKWADLMKNVHEFPVDASDIGVGGAGKVAGPIPGMMTLTGLDWKTCANDVEAQEELLVRCKSSGVPFSGLDQLETALCDFNTMDKGSYYVGHDTDKMMNQLSPDSKLWEARRRALPNNFLGEVMGWDGHRKELDTLYYNTGRIRWWEET